MKVLSFEEVLNAYPYGEISDLIVEAMRLGELLEDYTNFYSHFIQEELKETVLLKHFFHADEIVYNEEFGTLQIMNAKMLNIYGILNLLKGNENFNEIQLDFLEDLLRNLPDGMAGIADNSVKILPTQLNRYGTEIIKGLNAFEEIYDLFLTSISSVICGDNTQNHLIKEASFYWASAIVRCLEIKDKKYHDIILHNKESKDLFKNDVSIVVLPVNDGLKILAGESYGRNDISQNIENYFRASLAICLEDSISMLKEGVELFFSLLEDDCQRILRKIDEHKKQYIYEDTYLEHNEVKFLCEEDKIFAIIDPHGNEVKKGDSDKYNY